MILGDPGSGKSTLVDWLAWQLADAHHNAWKALLGSRIPIPLILRDLRLTRGVTWDGLLDAFLAQPIGKHLSREHLLRLMGEGHALVMLDGLDEVGDLQVRRDLRDAVQAGLRRFGRCPSLFTSRVVGYDDVPFHVHPDTLRTERTLETVGRPGPDPFATLAYIAPFDDPQIGQFARNWYAAREANAERAREGAEHLVQAVHRDRDTLRLARVPNLLTMMALIHRNRATLPNGKALLYEDIAQAYLKTIDEFRHIAEFTDSLQDMKRWLGEVGFKMQQRRREDQRGGSGHRDRRRHPPQLAGSGHGGDRQASRRRRRSPVPRHHQAPQRPDDRTGRQSIRLHPPLVPGVLRRRLPGRLGHVGRMADGRGGASRHGGGRPPAVCGGHHLGGNVGIPVRARWRGEAVGEKKIREAVFGPGWSAVTGPPAARPQTASVLARLTSDPHVSWDAETQASAVDRCLAVVAEYHQNS